MYKEPDKHNASEWIDTPERSNLLALRGIVWIALILGRRIARLFLYPICLYFLLFARAARDASRKYLHKVLGRKPHVIDMFLHIHTFASTILDRVFLLNGRYDKFDIKIHMSDAVQAALEKKQGCILLGAHFGSFEITRAYAHQMNAAPVNIVMYEENARKLNSVLHAINPGLAQSVIALGKVDSMLKVRQALQNNEFIGILADRGLNDDSNTVCDFLGEAAKFPSGPLRMAYMLKSPLLLMFGVYRGGKRYDLYFEQLADINTTDGMTRDEVLRLAMQRYVAAIERHCHDAPYNWFNFYDFWKK